MSLSRTKPSRVLVVGWGFLGSAIGLQLRRQGLAVSALTPTVSLRTEAARALGIEIVLGRAETPGALSRLLPGVDYIVYTAGGLLPLEASREPLKDASHTILPWIATLEELRHYPETGAILVSSGGTVYGNPERIPVHETDGLLPISSYGVSRESCELYARTYARTYGLNIQVARCANVYGPDQPHDRSQGAVAVFMHRLQMGEPITIFGDGRAIRDYVYVDDVAYAVGRLICERSLFDVVNIGSGQGHTALELLDALTALIGRQTTITFAPARPHDVRAIVLDVSRLRSLIEYEPLPLDLGLRRLWEQQRADATAFASNA